MTTDIDDIVDAASDPKIAVLIAASTVTSELN